MFGVLAAVVFVVVGVVAVEGAAAVSATIAPRHNTVVVWVCKRVIRGLAFNFVGVGG